MNAIYEKLLKQLETMTPEQLKAEWEELKEYNFGPTMEEYKKMVIQYNTMLAQYPFEDYSIESSVASNDSKTKFYLAA
jgi:hypothetical protein